jgi:hypothetical protein
VGSCGLDSSGSGYGPGSGSCKPLSFIKCCKYPELFKDFVPFGLNSDDWRWMEMAQEKRPMELLISDAAKAKFHISTSPCQTIPVQ